MPRRPIALLLAGIALAACETAPPPTTDPPGPHTLEAPEVSFWYPADWEVLDGLEAEGGLVGAAPTAVGRLDGAGNLVGAAVQVSTADPAVPSGEERAYLAAAFDPTAARLWAGRGGVVRERDWSTLAGLEARRYLVEYTARGERLLVEIRVAVDGATVVALQCQAPEVVFDATAVGCGLVAGTLDVAPREGSTVAPGA